MTHPDLSIIVPAFNEESRLANSLKRIIEFLNDQERDFEILVVDDGSADHTSKVVEGLVPVVIDASRLRVLKNERNRGKGYSVRRGMLEAKGNFALLTDADLSTPIEELLKLEGHLLRGNYQIAFGSRDIEGADVQIRQSWFRENAGKVFNRIVRALTPLPFRDTQCGFKLFDLKTCRDVFLRQRIERYAFDVEILFIAQKRGLSLIEVPVVWRHSEGSKVRLFPDAPLTMLDLVKVW